MSIISFLYIFTCLQCVTEIFLKKDKIIFLHLITNFKTHYHLIQSILQFPKLCFSAFFQAFPLLR